MKMNDRSIGTSMIEKKVKELFKETKETLATELMKDKAANSTFTVVDLWRTQKKQKTLGSSTKW
ncbi:hypothetical protein BH11BAC4_BH11BAC4_25180 [soil metagenome]